MPTAQGNEVNGTFIVPSNLPATLNLNLGFIPNYFEMINLSKLGVNSGAYIQRVYWNSSMPSNGSQGAVEYITSAATTMNIASVAANGITPYDGRQSILLGPVLAGTSITKVGPAVATVAAHGLQTGDQVLMSNNVVMKQLGGMVFTVTVLSANTFSIPINTNTANFTAETGFSIRKILVGPSFYPQRLVITGISAANPAVVSTSINHGLTVGQQVRIRVPSQFGMSQMNNLQGIITSVPSVTSFTLGIDSSAFTAFAFPAVSSVPFSFAQVIPVGSGPTPVTSGGVTYNVDLLDDQTDNQQFQGISIGTGILSATAAFVTAVGDVYSYSARRSDFP